MGSIDLLVAVAVALVTLAVVLPGLAVGYLLARYVQLPAMLSLWVGPLGIGRRAGLLGVGVAGAGVVGIELVAGGVPDDPGLLYRAGLYATLPGACGVAVGAASLRRYLAIRAGRVASGPATPAEGSVASPVGGRDCLAWAVRVREHRSLVTRGPSPPIYAETGGPEFGVEGDVERHRVDAATADLRLWPVHGVGDVDTWWRWPDGDPNADGVVRGPAVDGDGDGGADSPRPRDRIRSFTEDRDLPGQRHRRAYEEVRVSPGESVTVVWEPTLLRRRSGPAVLATPEPAVRRTTRRRVAAGAAGAVGVVCGTLAMAVGVGVV
jgi:hypothetical protein